MPGPLDAVDPRAAVVEDRLAGVGRIVAVTGSKGGIGKSVVSASLALAWADAGRRVGLLDLDFTSPCSHVILGADEGFPGEGFGVDPKDTAGVSLMSVAFFAPEVAVPLRGDEVAGAFLELLAVTRWGELDLLVLDLPPGLGDIALDVVRLVPRVEFLLLSTSSRVVLGSVERALRLLTGLRVPVLGLAENLQQGNDQGVSRLGASFGVPFLGALPYDAGLEDALGDPGRLRATAFFAAVRRLAGRLSG
ncbi:MAG: P-loop NTPase [Acidimicrobiia bacterium]|nr:P-loop NTPase [Acidimicrobiia bacterium]